MVVRMSASFAYRYVGKAWFRLSRTTIVVDHELENLFPEKDRIASTKGRGACGVVTT